MSLNALLDFVKSFVQWRDKKDTPHNFEVLAQRDYKDGVLLRVKREAITNRESKPSVATYAWIPNNKQKSFLYTFLDSLEGFSVRHLSHRVQILSSDRQLTNDQVGVHIHLSQSYWLGTNSQAGSILLKLIYFCHGRDYDSVNWDWELNECRKQILGYSYTEFSQEQARENGRFMLDRFEIRHSAPRTLHPVVLDRIIEIVDPSKKEPPKSRVVELMIMGSVLIALALIFFNAPRR
jgi:hypothetical protein